MILALALATLGFVVGLVGVELTRREEASGPRRAAPRWRRRVRLIY